MDEEGYFFITDRLKRMINASGFKVWPAEVEMLLYKHPAVQEACIIAAQRRLPRRDREGGRRAARRRQGQDRRPRTSSPGRASTWRPTRCRKIVEFVDVAAEVGLGQGDVAAAAGPGSGALSGRWRSASTRSSARRRARSARSGRRRRRRPPAARHGARRRSRSLVDAQHVERVRLAAAARRGRGAGLHDERGVAGERVARRGRRRPGWCGSGRRAGGRRRSCANTVHRLAGAADELVVAGLVGQVERMVGDDDLGHRRRAAARSGAGRLASAPR